MRVRTLFWPALGVLLVVIPPYSVERLTQFFFVTQNHLGFGSLTGTRYYFDVVYLPFSAWIVGRRFRDPTRTWLTYVPSVALLIFLYFAACEPRLCYISGADGLEPLRMGFFFVAEGIAAGYLGALGKGSEPKGRWQKPLSVACGFYAIAYNGVIFTLAGAKVLYPLDPFAELFFLATLSFVTTVNAKEGTGLADRLAPPILAQGILLLIGIGITWQYLPEVLPFVGWSFAAVVVGVSFGAVLTIRGKRVLVSLRKSRLPFTLLILFVLLTTLVIWPDAVAGQVTAVSNPGRPSDYSYAIPLTVGGFMSSPMVRPEAVALNVSFADSDSYSIQEGNFLGAGIGIHSTDCCTDGIDYGFRFDRQLWSNGSERLTASAWRICDTNAACGGHSWKVLLYYASIPYTDSGPSRPLRLVLEWQNRTVLWQYDSGGGMKSLGSFVALPSMNAAFNAGWLGPPDRPSPGGAFFFQFGVTSLRQPYGSWDVRLSCPSIMLNGTWGCIDHAESLQGDQSYWKVLWRWGETFPGVQGTSDPAEQSITLHNSNSTIGSFSKFW